MTKRKDMLVALLSLAMVAACDFGDGTDGGPDDIMRTIESGYDDWDSDTLTNQQENEDGSGVDTDGDGTPDYLDQDSDGDGILDIYEAGDLNFTTAPSDADSDGVPDFRDLDSDGNGIPDGVEGRDDFDGDGQADFRDIDDDDDLLTDVIEIVGGGGADCDGDDIEDEPGSTDSPFNCDGDSFPDFRDSDSDNDLIGDRIEGLEDTDGDGWLDRYDPDSDNDGLLDRDEIGEEGAVDTDGDLILDFRDPDSDGDGISDFRETAEGTDPRNADSDGDGASDLVELAAGTNPLFAGDSPQRNGDFIFLVPYEEVPDPQSDTLAFRTNFQQADVYFLFDRTGSMLAEVNAMRGAIDTIISTLTCERSLASCERGEDCAGGEICGASGFCLESPAETGCIPSFYTGAGVYGGDPATNSFDNLASVGDDGAATASSLPTEVGSYGTNESMFAAVQCMADPTSDNCVESYLTGCAESGIGCMGFRGESRRIMLLITDEDNEWDNSVFTAEAAGDVVSESGISFVGIDAANGGEGNGLTDMTDIANMAGSVGSDGLPLVRSGDGSTVVDASLEAIRELVNAVPTRVTIEAADIDEGASVFLDYLEINASGVDLDLDGTIDCEMVAEEGLEDTDADERFDAFAALRPGRRVCWDVHPRQNDTVEPTEEIQLFELELIVRGDGAVLDTRRVYFLVPPRPPEIGDLF